MLSLKVNHYVNLKRSAPGSLHLRMAPRQSPSTAVSNINDALGEGTSTVLTMRRWFVCLAEGARSLKINFVRDALFLGREGYGVLGAVPARPRSHATVYAAQLQKLAEAILEKRPRWCWCTSCMTTPDPM